MRGTANNVCWVITSNLAFLNRLPQIEVFIEKGANRRLIRCIVWNWDSDGVLQSSDINFVYLVFFAWLNVVCGRASVQSKLSRQEPVSIRVVFVHLRLSWHFFGVHRRKNDILFLLKQWIEGNFNFVRIYLHHGSPTLKVAVLYFLDLNIEILEGEVEAKILVVH